MKDNILIVGEGGREEALAIKLRESPDVGPIYHCSADLTHAEIMNLARAHDARLTVVGPEGPLVNGIVDDWCAAGMDRQGHLIFGPTKAAAQLEGSKVVAKEFMVRHNIPTAPYEVFDDYKTALEYVMNRKAPLVVKLDGLASGKGSFVCYGLGAALDCVYAALGEKRFGAAGERIIVEDFMQGEEASILALVDGADILPLVPSQDHKPAFETEEDRARWLAAGGDSAYRDKRAGPNTGGMGAYAPAPIVTPQVMARVMRKILVPTVHGMAEEKMPFKGCLYAGLMIEKNEPRVVEFNVRFGDPEAQVVLPLLGHDLYHLLLACVQDQLQNYTIKKKKGAACCVVMASGGYPGSYETGKLITGLDVVRDMDHVRAIHAATKHPGVGRVLTNGGRVLDVVGLGEDIAQAVERAYRGVEQIHWEREYHRTDIGQRALRD
jgi:phosphoribosylamine--glycine ligase